MSTATRPGPTGSHSDTRPGTLARTGSRLGLGVVVLWVSILVVLPLAALVATALAGGVDGLWQAVSAPGARQAIILTGGLSLAVTAVNAVMGTVIAWVLVRDEFPGRALLDAAIDLPFALPTIVASIVLLSLYGPASPLGIHANATRWGVLVALAFVTLPFVVRGVQPVLKELDLSAEEASSSLGASGWTTFRRIILPALWPALASGCGLTFARALGEFGSVVLIGGNIPGRTQVASQYIQQRIEAGEEASAAAVSLVLLVIAFAVLLGLRALSSRGAHDEEVAAR